MINNAEAVSFIKKSVPVKTRECFFVRINEWLCHKKT